MEAIFAYELIDEYQEQATNEMIPAIKVHNETPVLSINTKPAFGNIVEIVRKASSLALNRLKRKKQQGVQKSSLVFVGQLLKKNVGTIFSGIRSLITKGVDRPSWNYTSNFTYHFIRDTLVDFEHSLTLARMGESEVGKWTKFMASGCDVAEIQIVVDIDALLVYEKQGKAYTNTTNAWRYPIPDEDQHNLPVPGQVLLNCEWVVPNSLKLQIFKRNGMFQNDCAKRKVLYYLHGGAYILGSTNMYRNLMATIGTNVECPVFAINYRLAPEHPFPSALHDAFAGYLWLVNPYHKMFANSPPQTLHEPYGPEQIIIAGDSAGGGIAQSLLNYLNMYLRNENGDLIIPYPRAAILLSPWCDLSCSSQSWEDNQGLDFLPSVARELHTEIFKDFSHPAYSYCFGETRGRKLEVLSPVASGAPVRIPSIMNLSADKLRKMISEKSRKEDRQWINEKLDEMERDILERFVRHPLVSPVFGEFMSLPPILIQTGDCELLRDENIALAYRYKAHNENNKKSWVRHELYVDMVHDFQIASAVLPSARLAMKQFKLFFNEVFSNQRSAGIMLTKSEADLMKLIDSHNSIDVSK